MWTDQDLEIASSPRKDSLLVRSWRSFLQSDFCPAKHTHMYALFVSILFLGTICIAIMSNLSPYNSLSRQTQEIPLFAPNATLKSASPSNLTAPGAMDISAQIQKAVIIDANPSTTPPDSACYQNMSATWHHMSDEELRQRAAKAPEKPKGARIAFMFIVKGPMPFVPLWERYFHGHEEKYSIYIHAHPDYVPSFDIDSPFFERFIPSKVAEWGKVSLQEAENHLLFNGLLDDTNSWFILVSESCIPIENFPETYKHITESRHNFVMAFQESKALHRTRLYRGKHQDMAPEVTVDNFRKGSQWFQINRDFALLVANDATYYKKFVNYFCQPHPICYIDEHYLPTLFSITHSEALASRTLMFFEFRHHDAHPIKWDETNTDAHLIKSIRNGHSCNYNGQPTTKCFFFARKFDPSSLPNLLGLAHEIMSIP